MIRFFFVPLLLLIWVTPAFAVGFDIWETGMARQEIFSLAQRYNLPLTKSGLHHIRKGFNPKSLVGDATQYYYRTTLLDHPARICLYLSPNKAGYGQFLYQIEVMFIARQNRKDLRSYVARMLGEKYGSPRLGTNIAQNFSIWRPDAESEVRLITGGSSIQIKYTDRKIQAFASELSKSTYELPIEPVDHRDARKF